MVNDQMVHIHLPISKSIANRILLLQAIHGDPLMRVSSDMPDDVIVLHDALQQIRDIFGTPEAYASSPSSPLHGGTEGGLGLSLKNCGTALRFLQVHIAKCYPGAPITLTGDPRLMERNGAPTTQTTSALILHGEPIPVSPDESPYITMSRRIRESYSELRERSYSETVLQRSGLTGVAGLLEPDWSSAAFWYEYIAIHGGELLLEGLTENSLQGDRIVADLYATHFGVQTEFVENGAVIRSVSEAVCQPAGRSLIRQPKAVSLNFERIPDLYPAIALTCERLGITLRATGTDRLRFKESDRLEAVRLHEVRNDHRMAMALMCADFPVSEQEQGCIAKSFPEFVEVHTATTRQRHGNDRQCQYEKQMPSVTHITPKKGINDDNMGKKHALSKLIHAAATEYVWLHDDDVILPPVATDPVCQPEGRSVFCQPKAVCQRSGLVILPLKMESESDEPSLLEKLQIAEYAAIQELTMRTAKAGHAVMCSGANLIVRREAWLACEPDLHPEIPSGDDMFLLEAMKKRGYKIAVIDEPDFTAVVHPAPTWRAFFRQRMRWAGKAPKYTDPDIIRCGVLVVAVNLLQILCPLIILIKFPIEYSLIRQRQMREQKSQISNLKSQISNLSIALLLEFLYPFYIIAVCLGGLVRTKQW